MINWELIGVINLDFTGVINWDLIVVINWDLIGVIIGVINFGVLNEEMPWQRVVFLTLGFMPPGPGLRPKEVPYMFFRAQKSA